MKNRLTPVATGGFTLIELVVVIVILGILMAVAIPKYIDITDKAKQAADRGQLGALRTCTHMLYAKNILDGLSGTNAWPAATNIWAQLQTTNAWKYYNQNGTNIISYIQTSGIWRVSGAE